MKGPFVNWPFDTSRGLEVTVSDKTQAKKEPFRSIYGKLKLMERAQTEDKTNKLTVKRALRFLCRRALSGITSFENSATSPLCTNIFMNLFHLRDVSTWAFLWFECFWNIFLQKCTSSHLESEAWGDSGFSDVSMHKTYFESVSAHADRKMSAWLLAENTSKIEIKSIDRKDFEKITGIDLSHIALEIKGLPRKPEHETRTYMTVCVILNVVVWLT